MKRTLAAISIALTAAVAAAQESGPATLGTKDEAKWTRSTIAAATTKEAKQVLGGAQVATVVGQVVDAYCFLQLAAIGNDHLECAKDCLKRGQPGGILDERGNLTLIAAEQHDGRRMGTVTLPEKLAELAGKQVTATGLLTERGGIRVLWVRSAEAVAPPATP